MFARMLMKKSHLHYGMVAAVAIVLSACHSKQNPVEELEKAAVALDKIEKPEKTPAANTGDYDPAAAPAAGKQLKEAIADYKAGKMEDAVTRLQLLRAQPILSPQQRMAVQDSIAAVMAEVYALAEKGDARAAAAVAQYEKMQTGRH